jgi:hypothetical protein
MSGMYGNFTLPELENKLESLVEGALLAISARDYERLFGTNDAAFGRVRNFAKAHSCVTSPAEHGILFRKESPLHPSR